MSENNVTDTTGLNFPEPVNKALEIAMNYGGCDGGHHKMWVIDQMVRVLTGDKYKEWVKFVRAGEDGPMTYEWEEGIAP